MQVCARFRTRGGREVAKARGQHPNVLSNSGEELQGFCALFLQVPCKSEIRPKWKVKTHKVFKKSFRGRARGGSQGGSLFLLGL